jgi:tetratricopeptide (TPR) repeat protein
MSIQYTADQLQRKFRGAPGSPGFSRIAEVLRIDGRIDEAIQTCQDGLRSRPNALSGHLVLGKCLLDASRIEEARESFEAALRLDSRCLSAMHHLARIMTKLQWGDAAAGYYRSILEVEPWDAGIRALLSGAAPQPHAGAAGISAPASAPEAGSFAAAAGAFSAAPVQPAHLEEDTFHKPEGFSGDVMEVNLNDMASDFLPSQDDTSLGLEEESLEDALAASAGMGRPERRETAAPAEDAAPAGTDAEPADAEPRPLDVLKPETPAPMEAIEGDAPPISGQDVEDRLDSLFGVEDAPAASLRDATATWSPAPPEAPAPEIPLSSYAPDLSDRDGSATATGEFRAADTGEIPIRSGSGSESGVESDFTGVEAAKPFEIAEIPGAQDFSAVDFASPPGPAAPAAAGDEHVHGEDIERRLDELFNLTEEDDRPPVESSSLPVAPGPKVGEAVAMGEVVSFGGEVLFAEPEAAVAETAVPEAALEPIADEAMVTGQDVADKLDNLFGADPENAANPALNASATAERPFPVDRDSGVATAHGTQSMPMDDEAPDPAPWPAEGTGAAQPPPAGAIMSTESLLPPGWFGEAGDGPRITGSDVEAQLDKLFQLEAEGETIPGAASAEGNTGNTSAFLDRNPAQDAPARPMPGDEADLTVMMPAFRDPSAASAKPPADAGRVKESVADWLSKRSEEADVRTAAERAAAEAREMAFGEAGDTLILPAGEDGLAAEDQQALKDFDATLELPSASREGSLGAFGDEPEGFGTLAPDDAALLTDTTSIEMVDGVDVAGRLDELFADEPTAEAAAGALGKSGADAEMSLFMAEDGEGMDHPVTAAGSVSGEDVSSRLQQLFGEGDPAAPSQPESGVAAGLETGEAGLETSEAGLETSEAGLETGETDSETDEDMLPATGSAKPDAPAAPKFAPMTDEEEGYPEDEEMPSQSQSGTGANVATVTLAEIYFQQGLREQALQIYRQLLEREPENESARKRIEEIEATKPEDGDRGPGSDPRRPRPGLKVPKRKK